MENRKNAFDLLRLLLALLVVITHSYFIGGYHIREPLDKFSQGQTNFGELGVMSFFALSGFLITASFERTGNILAFASHRILRIFPGFWVCLLVIALGITPLIYWLKGMPADYLTGDNSSIHFVLSNFFLQIKQWSIKNTIIGAAYPDSLDGSLWSLYPEFLCYMATIVCGYLGLFNRNKLLYLITFICIMVFFVINFNYFKSFGPTLLRLSPALKLYASYMAGSIVYVYKDQLIFDLKGSIFALLFALMLLKFGGFHLVSPLLIAIVLINIFQSFTVHLKYDISYGVYIYSFPVQQVLFVLIANRLPVGVFIMLSFGLSAILGFLSYTIIEKPAISLRRKTDGWFGIAKPQATTLHVADRKTDL